MKKTLILCLIVFAVNTIYAQSEKVELKLSLRDGNVISGTSTSIKTVLLVTDFGKLEIPIKNVSSIDFGITPDVTSKTKVENLIKQMADPTEEKRQAAYDELVKMSINTIPVLSDYIYGENYQISEYTDYSPENALSEMKSLYGVDESYNDKDIINIDYEYNIGGEYAIKSISLKTEFGELNIPKEKIKNVEVSYFDALNGDKTFKLIASKHISGNENDGWLSTGIKVKSGQKINISAFGEITLESLSGNKYTPDGNTSTEYENDYSSTYPTYGNVVYRIGEEGESIKAGSKYSGTAKASGIIYLSIYETVFNASNTGFYSVKVSVK